MHTFLAANFSGLFESAICFLLHAVFIIAAVAYVIRVFVVPSETGWRGVPRWLLVLMVFCVQSAFWAFFANERSAEISLSQMRYLPVAPLGFLLCMGAAQFSSRMRR